MEGNTRNLKPLCGQLQHPQRCARPRLLPTPCLVRVKAVGRHLHVRRRPLTDQTVVHRETPGLHGVHDLIMQGSVGATLGFPLFLIAIFLKQSITGLSGRMTEHYSEQR